MKHEWTKQAIAARILVDNHLIGSLLTKDVEKIRFRGSSSPCFDTKNRRYGC